MHGGNLVVTLKGGGRPRVVRSEEDRIALARFYYVQGLTAREIAHMPRYKGVKIATIRAIAQKYREIVQEPTQETQ